MQTLLSAIGFEKIKGLEEETKLTQLMIKNLSRKNLYRIDDKRSVAEAFFEVADNCGVIMRGESGDNQQLLMEHYFPAYISENISMESVVSACKRMDSDAYTIMTDDDRLGITLIFYLQNKNEMISSGDFNSKTKKRAICLSGLAYEGKIILPAVNAHVPQPVPVMMNPNNVSRETNEENDDSEEAKMDMEAWVLEDFDKYQVMQTRAQKEDLYSLIDTTFIPYGSESDNYSIVGYIKNVKELENMYSKEKIYVLDVMCNDVLMAICINAKKLLGEPKVGRRFKGKIWLQGMVDWR